MPFTCRNVDFLGTSFCILSFILGLLCLYLYFGLCHWFYHYCFRVLSVNLWFSLKQQKGAKKSTRRKSGGGFFGYDPLSYPHRTLSPVVDYFNARMNCTSALGFFTLVLVRTCFIRWSVSFDRRTTTDHTSTNSTSTHANSSNNNNGSNNSQQRSASTDIPIPRTAFLGKYQPRSRDVPKMHTILLSFVYSKTTQQYEPSELSCLLFLSVCIV